MKKIIPFVCLVLCMSFVFASCKKSDKHYDSNTQTAAEYSVEPSSSAVNVTDENGETVLDDNGEVATEIVTETTEKQDYKYNFYFEFTAWDGVKQGPIIFKTNNPNLMEALKEYEVVDFSGSGSDYKYEIQGISLLNGYSWRFYINGDLYEAGPENVKIENGATYAFAAYED